MKEDCFACEEKNVFVMGCMERKKTCSALNTVLCEKKRTGGRCPFYKPRSEWERYMIEHHGTLDVTAVVKAYQKTFGG